MPSREDAVAECLRIRLCELCQFALRLAENVGTRVPQASALVLVQERCIEEWFHNAYGGC
jgi:hypothetical protein